jgi:hypothetical protein
MAAYPAVVTATPVDEKSAPIYAEVINSGGTAQTATASNAYYDPTYVGPRVYPSPEQINTLKAMGVPPGLADSLGRSAEATARRYWIVDNSGSMSIQGERCLSIFTTQYLLALVLCLGKEQTRAHVFAWA